MSSTSSSVPTDIPCDSVLSSFSRWTLRTSANTSIQTASSGNGSSDPASGDSNCNSSSYTAPSSPCTCCSSIQKPALTVATHDDYDELSSDAETLSPSLSSSFSSSSFGGVSRSASENDVASLALSSSSDVDVETDAGCLNEMLEQSPIDIRGMESQLITLCEGDVTVALGKTEAELVHQGPNFFIRWKSAEHNTLTIRGKTFHAVQFHFHTPSEHTFDGQHEAMEFHMVHQAADGNLAVIAVFFREGTENAFLAQFWDALPGLDPDVPVSIPVGKIDPQKLDMLSGRFFRYRGSLTTPPYTEGVEWIIVQDVAEASRDQLDTFRNFLSGPNARPVQPLNKRRVSLVL